MATLQDIAFVGRSGLTAQQQLMSNVSQNLANAGTKGYHRRITLLTIGPDQSASIDSTNKVLNWGGVAIGDTTRVYNDTQESMLRGEQSNEEYHTQKGAALNDLQSLLNGSGTTSLDTQLQTFWSGWQAVANNPTDVGARGALIENGASLAGTFQDLSQRLTEYRNGLASVDGSGNPTGTIPDVVTQINTLAGQIQTLNNRLSTSGPTNKAFDLKDQRNNLLSDLSKLTDISVASDGTVSLDGQMLVSGNGQTLNTLVTATTTGPVTFTLGGTVVSPTSGSLAAWADAAAAVDAASSNMDILANTLMTNVNTLHASGFDLDGNPASAFFTGTDASTIAVNTTIHDPAHPNNDTPRAIAAAATQAGAGLPNAADGKLAQQIVNLATTTFPTLNGETLSGQYNNQLAKIGTAINSEKQSTTSSTNVVQMLTNSIQQESGVNTDEEMINMITSQRAYQAAAKVVATTNEMMSTVLALVSPSTG